MIHKQAISAGILKIYRVVLAVGFPEAHPRHKDILRDIKRLTAMQEVLVWVHSSVVNMPNIVVAQVTTILAEKHQKAYLENLPLRQLEAL